MAKTLQDHFAIIRDREEVLKDIYAQKHLQAMFEAWNKEHQELFLDYCTGMRGVKILYDVIFKLVMNPEVNPERLEKVLSLLLKQKVTILHVLPNKSTQIAAEKPFVILDIVVELEDKSIANIEVQRNGYALPGQRSACYSADLLMRQYKRIKAVKKKTFRYKEMKKVYTIVFFETSRADFRDFPGAYIHYFKQKSDTGIQVELLQEYIFVSLDNFKKQMQNKNVRQMNELEAWLTFLSEDNPERILQLIEAYPEFEVLYQEIYQACRNVEEIMWWFSDELLETDKREAEFMYEEMRQEAEEMRQEAEEMRQETEAMRQEAELYKKQLDEKDVLIAKLHAELAKQG